MLKSVIRTALGVDFQYNFYVLTCVKFKFANKIEAVYERSHVIITSLNFTFDLNNLYFASILFT